MAPRLIWTDYVAQLVHQNEFGVTFRMSLYSFNKLVDLLRLRLSVDEHQNAYRRPNYNRRRNEGILNFEQYENSNWM